MVWILKYVVTCFVVVFLWVKKAGVWGYCCVEHVPHIPGREWRTPPSPGGCWCLKQMQREPAATWWGFLCSESHQAEAKVSANPRL